MELLPLVAFIFIFLLTFRNGKYKKQNYEWYKNTYPEKANNNRIRCFVCDNDHIHVRGLRNRTYYREHFCTQCGKTLYFSPESS